MLRIMFLSLTVLASSQALAEVRIDSSDQGTFDRSIASMRRELPPEKLARLNGAIAVLPFAGMESFKDTPADGAVKLDIKRLNGMNADQIIELAQKTVTVKFRVGPPPGLPSQFKSPLHHTTSAASRVGSVVGTEWTFTDNINGHISDTRVKLLAGGRVEEAGDPAKSRWEQVGPNVRITLNDNYAVYLGKLSGNDSMAGNAGNIEGLEWTWVATREALP